MEKLLGWTVYIVGTADGFKATGMCHSFKRRLGEINVGKGGPFFGRRKYRRPIKILFKEDGLPFLEAYAKLKYMREMSTKLRNNLIIHHHWPMGGPWKEYVKRRDPIIRMKLKDYQKLDTGPTK